MAVIAAGAVDADHRLASTAWRPRIGGRRRTVLLLVAANAVAAAWYLQWLLRPERVGQPVLFALLVVAECFNLAQAVGFWWTVSRRPRRHVAAPLEGTPTVDILIPTVSEQRAVIEPTIRAAVHQSGVDARVWVLDDGRRPWVATLAEQLGAGYLTRPDGRGAKAGNLNHALARLHAPFVAVFDCDHVPVPDACQRLLGHLGDERVAFAQAPQHYANADDAPIAAAAWSQQALFFGPIGVGKDAAGSMICCGTGMVFRRRALDEVGGFPEDSLTEDFELTLRLHEAGWESTYVPEVVASGLGPEDMAAYVSQQHRWARGCISALPRILRADLPWKKRVAHLLSAGYFLSGFTVLLYMLLPLIRLTVGAQPLGAASADQFLLHFVPYFVGCLATVALVGAGSFTFDAFALASTCWWVSCHAAAKAVFRRPSKFVVTPKERRGGRQIRAVWPSLAMFAALVVASVVGAILRPGPAALNNVAFAGLHAVVLARGMRFALFPPGRPQPASADAAPVLEAA